jgi:hypothetical protein
LALGQRVPDGAVEDVGVGHGVQLRSIGAQDKSLAVEKG